MAITRQYDEEAEAERARLARALNEEYGFTPAELIKLTGMKIRIPEPWQKAELDAAYMEGAVS